LKHHHNYKVLIDYEIHPIFKFLKYNDSLFIKGINKNENTIELIPPISYNEIYNILKSNFESNNNIYVLTNSFHSQPRTDDNYNNSEINEANNYLKNILLPNNLLSLLLKKRFNKMNMDINNLDNKYIVIHLRFNDNCLFNNNFILDENHKIKLYNVIDNIKNNNHNKKIIIISNYYKLIEDLKTKYDNIFFNKNNPIHLGSLDKNINLNELEDISDIEDNEKNNIELILLNKLDKKIKDTLIDLFILTKASEIFAISQYGETGFSNEISQIYNIPYHNMSSSVF
jgi:hypothetical protein